MAQNQQRYRVVEKIAAGGMAEVFRAESAGVEGFKKTVAIKRVLSHLSEKKQFIGMFLDEARLSAHLTHSNCVQVFDIGMGDNTYFIVMEYVDGSDLKTLIEYTKSAGRPFSLEEACLICVKICEGLSYAHNARDGRGQPLNLVHRDMSPPNVLITRYGEIKIVDFGLAKANSQLERSEPGIIKGKFGYLSPEAAYGQVVDSRTDIFAVGIILWEILAGRRLFLGETDFATVQQVQAAVIPSIRDFNRACPESLERVLQKALAREPSERYQTAAELGRDLNGVMFAGGRPVSSFDIAALVESHCTHRERQRSGKQRDRGAIIGSMIEEALFEFTSIDKSQENSSLSPAQPLSLRLGNFENVQDWANDISDLGVMSEPAPPEPEIAPQIGNLAALEDSEIEASKPPSSRRSRVAEAALFTPASSKKQRLLLILGVALLVVGASALAYRLGSHSSSRPVSTSQR